MTPEAQRIAIAETCGWEIVATYSTSGVYGYWKTQPSYDKAELPPMAVPNYLSDLNAMHEAEKVLNDKQYLRFKEYLAIIVGTSGHLRVPSATAAQRAEAFLRTLNLWKD